MLATNHMSIRISPIVIIVFRLNAKTKPEIKRAATNLLRKKVIKDASRSDSE